MQNNCISIYKSNIRISMNRLAFFLLICFVFLEGRTFSEVKTYELNNLIPKKVNSGWLLFEKIESFKSSQKLYEGFEDTGLKKSDYLKVIHNQILVMQNLQVVRQLLL